MTDIHFVTSAPQRRRRHGFDTLMGLIAAWDERIRYRHDLEKMAEDNPHLIDDIGLSKRQAETEIAKPFWEA